MADKRTRKSLHSNLDESFEMESDKDFSPDESDDYVPSPLVFRTSSTDNDDVPTKKPRKNTAKAKNVTAKTKNVTAKSGDSETEKKKSNRKAAKDEKVMLAKLVEDEEIIWNIRHELHSNTNAMSAAWDRIATQMNRSGKSSILT